MGYACPIWRDSSEAFGLPSKLWWEGPGWYAGRQTGEYAGECYEYWRVGADGETADREARRRQLGTPFELATPTDL